MDTNVTEGLRARNPGNATIFRKAGPDTVECPPTSSHIRNPVLGLFLAWRDWTVSSLRTRVWSIVVLAAILSLSLTGCTLLGGGDGTEATVASPTEPKVRRNSTPTPTPAQQPQPAAKETPTQTQHFAEAKRPPAATSSKGAEKLVRPITPALPRPDETANPPAEAKAGVSPSAKEPAPGSSAGLRELVFKGPPRVLRPSGRQHNTQLWLGLVLVALVAGLGALLLLKRQRKSPKASASQKEELVMPKEFLLKDPAPLPREQKF